MNRIFVSLILIMSFPVASYSDDGVAEWCDKQWSIESSKLSKQNPPDYQDLLVRWEKYAHQCHGTITYEARLATAYLFVNQFDKARQQLTALGNGHSKYGHLVDFVSLQLEQAESTVRGLKREDVLQLERKYILYVKKYPDFWDAYCLLGGIQSALDEHQTAIPNLEKGLRSSMDVSGVYRNLTVSYAAVDRYQDALKAADKAIQMKPGVTSDQYFIFALAKANGGVGNFRDAETALKLIVMKKPQVRQDPEFVATVNTIKAKMAAAKTQKAKPENK